MRSTTRLCEWRRWFAWHPVLILTDDDRRMWVWLETVERFSRQHYGHHHTYRLPVDG